MPFSVSPLAGADVSRLAADTKLEFDRLRSGGIGVISYVDVLDLPTDGSLTAVVTTDANGVRVVAAFDGVGAWISMLDGSQVN